MVFGNNNDSPTFTALVFSKVKVKLSAPALHPSLVSRRLNFFRPQTPARNKMVKAFILALLHITSLSQYKFGGTILNVLIYEINLPPIRTITEPDTCYNLPTC